MKWLTVNVLWEKLCLFVCSVALTFISPTAILMFLEHSNTAPLENHALDKSRTVVCFQWLYYTKVLYASHVKERPQGHNWVLDLQQASQKELADPIQWNLRSNHGFTTKIEYKSGPKFFNYNTMEVFLTTRGQLQTGEKKIKIWKKSYRRYTATDANVSSYIGYALMWP